MNLSPAFLVYGRDRLEFRFQRLTLAAYGAAWKLECLMWTNGTDQCSLPDNNASLARALGTTVEQWLELRKEIQTESDQYFEEKDGRLFSRVMRIEAARQRKYRKLQSERGKRSAQQRLNRGSTAVQPEGNSSSSLKHRERKGLGCEVELNGRSPSFELFWGAYPKKEGKGVCRRWWKEHNPDEGLLGLMLAKIEQAKQTQKWSEQSGKFIPMPATWLNQERWDDEYHIASEQEEPLPL